MRMCLLLTPARLTSSIVYVFDPDPVHVDARHDGVYRVDFGGRGKGKNLSIQETNEILPVNSLVCLLAYVKCSTEANVAEGPYLSFGNGVEFLGRTLASMGRESYECLPKSTLSGNTSRSCRIHVLSRVTLIWSSSDARLISVVASRSLVRVLSISMCEFGQSDIGVHLRSSQNRRGYLQILWIGCHAR